MPVAAPVSVEEYLKTSYHPDCDYVDGEVLERNLGEFEHSSTQREILFYLGNHYPALRKRLLPEQRVQVAATRYRIPDICVLAGDSPREQIITTPPILCIEILSPEDTMSRMMVKVKDYFQMGVPTCWIIDPVGREGWMAIGGSLQEVADGVLRADGIEMCLSDVLE